MNDKELLRKIKNVRTAVKEIYGNVNTITYPIYMVDWLIEQVEKVEQLQQEIASLKEALNESVKTSVALDNELQQEQAKTERYEKALKEIAEWSGIASREYRIAKKALEGTE